MEKYEKITQSILKIEIKSAVKKIIKKKKKIKRHPYQLHQLLREGCSSKSANFASMRLCEKKLEKTPT